MYKLANTGAQLKTGKKGLSVHQKKSDKLMLTKKGLAVNDPCLDSENINPQQLTKVSRAPLGKVHERSTHAGLSAQLPAVQH